ncbi:LacI family DNA-binding transcriptional regulator [Glutamicibacter endophyticus]|uniref:LacI family DNA-binding transcriptional regulator n=1 Tax=Glutamicibacter endophyticus TaxID=1522174 RepID=UPI003AF1C466
MSTSRPTARDVAQRAGVSRSAVSMVMNGTAAGNVSAAAQKRIREAARALDYRPDPLGVSLRQQRTGIIGIVTDEIASSPFAGKLISGVNSAAADRGYLSIISDIGQTAFAGPGTVREEHAIRQLIRRRVDALILATNGLRTLRVPKPLLTLPAAMANCRDAEGLLAAFIADEREGAQRATEHLTALGHRRILFIGGGDDEDAIPARLAGYHAAMTTAGLEPLPRVAAGWEINDGFTAAQVVLTGTERPTAVFAANDRVATGVLLAAGGLGLLVPQDLSILGFDDQPHLAEATVPGLSTMGLPHFEMGRQAAEHVLNLLDGQESKTNGAMIHCHLTLRDSTGPAPAGFSY